MIKANTDLNGVLCSPMVAGRYDNSFVLITIVSTLLCNGSTTDVLFVLRWYR